MIATERDLKWLRLCVAGAEIFSTCSRRQFMAIIVDTQGHVLSTGYNGGPKGMAHCNDGGCPRASSDVAPGSSYANCIAIHAESNALLHSNYDARAGATIYVNGTPCYDCAKLIANSTLTRVVFLEDTKRDQAVEFLETQTHIEVISVRPGVLVLEAV